MKRAILVLALPLVLGAVLLTVPLGPARASCSPPVGTSGDDVIDCAGGNDTVYADGPGPYKGFGDDTVTVDGGDIVFGDSQSDGGNGNDVITATGDNNTLYGDAQSGKGGGDDTITLSGDDNTVFGDVAGGDGTGNDTITFGGSGNDVYADYMKSKGDSGGDDHVTYTNENGVGNYADGGPGFDTLHFDFEVDDATFNALDAAKGSSFGLLWYDFEELTRKIAELVGQAERDDVDCGTTPYQGQRPFNRWCEAYTGDANETKCHGLTLAQCTELGVLTP